jgi:formylglycine-generating enzyme required for sulfatase activity
MAMNSPSGNAHRLSFAPNLEKYVSEMQAIPAGSFRMGCDFDIRREETDTTDEQPVHVVAVSAFRLGSTPVTEEIWLEYCLSTGMKQPREMMNRPRNRNESLIPVTGVSWFDIMGEDGAGGFCAWASNLLGIRLTLPTEEQWEYAARGGLQCYEFPWGNEFDPNMLPIIDRTKMNQYFSCVRDTGIHRNGFGLTDMTGHVTQWCLDTYISYNMKSQTTEIISLDEVKDTRCVRGSRYRARPHFHRCAYRDYAPPSKKGPSFRLCSESSS